MNLAKSVVERLLGMADVGLDGRRPWDLVIHDPGVYQRVLAEGSLGLGESYVAGQWDCADLEELVFRLVESGLERKARFNPTRLAGEALARLVNLQPRGLARRTAEHYDTDNELFAEILGKHKLYSCGYYAEGDDLDASQHRKLDAICDGLSLDPSDRVLDVGGGWGELARHMALTRSVKVTSINVSDEQIRYARARTAGLRVDTLKCDYRDIQGSFDKIAIIAMMSHVGVKNHRSFFEKIHAVLAPGGAVFIDTVACNLSLVRGNPWIDRYVFPGAVFPSIAQISRGVEGLFVIERVDNHGPAYVKTLRAWNQNLKAAWPRHAGRHDERVRRMFEFFFLCTAGFFRAREFQNYAIVLSRVGSAVPRLGALRGRARPEPLLSVDA